MLGREGRALLNGIRAFMKRPRELPGLGENGLSPDNLLAP